MVVHGSVLIVEVQFYHGPWRGLLGPTLDPISTSMFADPLLERDPRDKLVTFDEEPRVYEHRKCVYLKYPASKHHVIMWDFSARIG